jgi:hypothetical protein
MKKNDKIIYISVCKTAGINPLLSLTLCNEGSPRTEFWILVFPLQCIDIGIITCKHSWLAAETGQLLKKDSAPWSK